MKQPVRLIVRIASLMLVTAAIAFSWACIERPMKVADPAPNVLSDFSAAQSSTRDVDLIFLVDTSLSMADEQQILRGNFPNLVRVLKDISGGLPNIHMGTITPDLGSSTFNIPGCERPGGDGGRFMKGVNNSCANPVNQKFVVDVEPRGCEIEKNIVAGQATTCSSHNCTQANCDQSAFATSSTTFSEPAGLQLAEDDYRCPRCRNYSGESLEDVFSCMATLGTGGCGMEQQLEAVKQALTTGDPANAGFLRKNAYLAIFIITDEDDCSVKNPALFDPAGDINSTFGVLTSFRCTEFGVVCDQPWQRVMPPGQQMTYTNCRPREANDPKNMLYPISVYTTFLTQLKSSEMLLVGAITGPYANQVTVGLDANQNPKLMPSCGIPTEGTDPSVRIKAFVESLTKPEDMSWAYTSICATDFSPALVGLGNRIKALTEVQCITTPLNGCPDPRKANGGEKLTQLPDEEAKVCDPLCSVQDIDGDGNVTDIPLCDSSYANGHPPKRDRNLPVAKCYHIKYNDACAIPCPPGSLDLGCGPSNYWYAPSRGAEIVISRRDDPPVGTKAKIACAGLPLREKLCYDGIDNDVDGLIDTADPDCSN